MALRAALRIAVLTGFVGAGLAGMGCGLLSPARAATSAEEHERARAQQDTLNQRLERAAHRAAGTVCRGCDRGGPARRARSVDPPRPFDPAQAPEFER